MHSETSFTTSSSVLILSFPPRRSSDLVRKYVAAHHVHDCVLWTRTAAFPVDYKSISFKGVEREEDSDSGPAPHYHRELDQDRKSTRLNSSHLVISYAVFCLIKEIMKNC